MFPLKRFYDTEAEFEEFCETLKHVACPHCHWRGGLIRHGHIYGYTENNDQGRILKGHRIRCNNRLVGLGRNGCGGTVSILGIKYLSGFWITATSLWLFLSKVLAGLPKAEAFRSLGIQHVASGAYRLIARVRQAQAHIRGVLHRHGAEPAPPEAADSLWATIRHLTLAFPDSTCPIIAFQRRFQIHFLTP